MLCCEHAAATAADCPLVSYGFPGVNVGAACPAGSECLLSPPAGLEPGSTIKWQCRHCHLLRLWVKIGMPKELTEHKWTPYVTMFVWSRNHQESKSSEFRCLHFDPRFPFGNGDLVVRPCNQIKSLALQTWRRGKVCSAPRVRRIQLWTSIDRSVPNPGNHKSLRPLAGLGPWVVLYWGSCS